MITAILDFNIFKGKIKLPNVQHEIRIPITLPLTVSWLQEAFVPNSPNKHPILTFELYKQIGKFTYKYQLKEIES